MVIKMYITNLILLAEIIECKKDNIISEKLHSMISEIIEKNIKKRYMTDDITVAPTSLITFIIERLMKVALKFDENKSNKPLSYFNTIIACANYSYFNTYIRNEKTKRK